MSSGTSKTITQKAVAEAVGKALSAANGSVLRLSGGQRAAILRARGVSAGR